MKLLITLAFAISFFANASFAATLKANSCEGGYIENKIFSARLFKDSNEDSYLELNVRASRLYSIKVSSMGEGLSLLTLINSNNNSDLDVLQAGEGFISKNDGNCVFNSNYRISLKNL